MNLINNTYSFLSVFKSKILQKLKLIYENKRLYVDRYEKNTNSSIDQLNHFLSDKTFIIDNIYELKLIITN